MIVFLHNYSEKSINYGNMEKIDCLKITEKVSFNIASGQKFNENAKKWSNGRVFDNLKLAFKQRYQICH